MSLYVFTLSDFSGAPDYRLLSLLNGRVKYEKVFFSPECAFCGMDMALYLGADCVKKESLSLKKDNETEREYILRIKKEGDSLKSLEGNHILLLPPENVKILCGMKEKPIAGYTEVI